ncbi:MAG: hypothetical protein I3274_07890 [Candidatus Moeniiplasma glomeromycotorum]|nr:hypothetical protein [Candidatus Moeniiplasma glomeromycotorum]MCE8168354.1 hypothetical protein [Candidatus Moeniiplasma glomeromycotorum]
MTEVKIVVYFKKHTNFPAYPDYKGQEYWNFKEKLNQDQIERGEKGWEVVIDKKHPCFKKIDLRAKWDENKADYCSIYELTFDENGGKPHQGNKKERWFDKEDIIKIDYIRERERERERAKLRNCEDELLNWRL